MPFFAVIPRLTFAPPKRVLNARLSDHKCVPSSNTIFTQNTYSVLGLRPVTLYRSNFPWQTSFTTPDDDDMSSLKWSTFSSALAGARQPTSRKFEPAATGSSSTSSFADGPVSTARLERMSASMSDGSENSRISSSSNSSSRFGRRV